MLPHGSTTHATSIQNDAASFMHSCRFPKSARLAQSFEFARVKGQGKVAAGEVYGDGGLSPEAAEEEGARIGLITSRRVGNAVLRNRVRRRLREIVRVERARMRPGLWIVLVARAAAVKVDLEKLRAEYLALGKRAGIFEAP